MNENRKECEKNRNDIKTGEATNKKNNDQQDGKKIGNSILCIAQTPL